MVLHDVSAQRPVERFDYWRNVICEKFTSLTPTPVGRDHADFKGSVELRPLGSVNRAVLGSTGQRVAHGPREVSRSDRGVFFINFQQVGTCYVRTDQGMVDVTPGQMTIVDTARPYWFEYHEPWQVMSFQVPHEDLSGNPDQYVSSTGRALDTSSGLGSVVLSLMESLWALEDDAAIAGGAGTLVERSFYSVVDAMLSTQRMTAAPADAIRLAALDHARRHLHDASLSASSTAKALAVSTRTLHYAFANEESFSQQLRTARLAAIARALQDTHNRASISDIANRHGMVDASSFSRTFRSHYSMTPRDYRARWRTGPA